MIAQQGFCIREEEKRRSICVELAEGTCKIELSPDTSQARAEEITQALNSVAQEVTFQRKESMQPDVERLNAEQPVSVAVQHP
jgi:hypothetical protein